MTSNQGSFEIPIKARNYNYNHCDIIICNTIILLENTIACSISNSLAGPFPESCVFCVPVNNLHVHRDFTDAMMIICMVVV